MLALTFCVQGLAFRLYAKNAKFRMGRPRSGCRCSKVSQKQRDPGAPSRRLLLHLSGCCPCGNEYGFVCACMRSILLVLGVIVLACGGVVYAAYRILEKRGTAK